MPQECRLHPTSHAPPRTRHARARTRTTPCSGHGCEIAWIKGLMMLQKSTNLLGGRGAPCHLPRSGLPMLAGRKGAWRGSSLTRGGLAIL